MKTMKGKIMEYVERNDINGLAEFARAVVEDEIIEREKLLDYLLENGPQDISWAMFGGAGSMNECNLKWRLLINSLKK